MTAIRRRLAFWYTVALGLTMLAFGAALYYERRQSSVEELDRRLALEADLAQRWLVESYRVLGPLVPDLSSPALDPGISAYLEAFRDYLIVVDTGGERDRAVRRYPAAGAAEFQQLAAPLYPPPARSASGTIEFAPPLGAVRYYVTRMSPTGNRRRRAAGGHVHRERGVRPARSCSARCW